MMLADKYLFRVIGTSGPSMLPTFDTNNNLLIVDQFTPKFIRKPKVGEIVILSNPFKPSATLVKRITASEGKMAEFWSHREGKN